ncbi:SMODS domain-containing nucleotidyltransferase [Reichenbachiella agariperforans]|uniref:SMODS domain-containing nucleotidyltransferase n=1 Tax=Reichenbachiella agariperforans TaxID=156994 RepID=UPI001C0A4B70|nr:hypothetical protein [Reichenbachiella agariperforans]MBU2912645.1 hypothetical protein [Reichenbachiella agariperforans]
MPRTVEQAFDILINRLAPLSSEHNKASTHKSSVQSSLTNSHGCTNLFETGSFGNETGVRHYSDTDYFAVIPEGNLSNNSATSLRQVKEALARTFWRTTGIAVNCPAVKIPFGQYKSEELEVTPSFHNGMVQTSLGRYRKYGIPNCQGGWMESSPAAHNAYVREQDKRLNYKLKPLIQLIKAWKYFNSVPIVSFYLELRVAKYAESESSIVYDVDVKRVLNSLNSNSLAAIRDPMGVSGLISPCQSTTQKETALSKLNTAATRAEKAMTSKSNGNIDNAFYWWNLLFKSQFPTR